MSKQERKDDCVVSTLLYGCEAWKLTEQVRRKLNATGSKNAFQDIWQTNHRRGLRALDRHRPMRQGPTLELAWTHPAHGRAPDGTPSVTAMRQANSRITFRRRPGPKHRQGSYNRKE